ncbi:MAG: phenol hydroxylase subunit P4 [SAR324 cluster bacterium]|nr:phenol hydroxylase subunit P4 [SAR324 cluster bacterium]
MPVKALKPGYKAESRDKLENFHGNQLVYVGWDHHVMFCSAMAFPLPAGMPFIALRDEVMKTFMGVHPDYDKINWDTAQWNIDGKATTIDWEKSLADHGVGHKSLIRLQTPELVSASGVGV